MKMQDSIYTTIPSGIASGAISITPNSKAIWESLYRWAVIPKEIESSFGTHSTKGDPSIL